MLTQYANTQTHTHTRCLSCCIKTANICQGLTFFRFSEFHILCETEYACCKSIIIITLCYTRVSSTFPSPSPVCSSSAAGPVWSPRPDPGRHSFCGGSARWSPTPANDTRMCKHKNQMSSIFRSASRMPAENTDTLVSGSLAGVFLFVCLFTLCHGESKIFVWKCIFSLVLSVNGDKGDDNGLWSPVERLSYYSPSITH